MYIKMGENMKTIIHNTDIGKFIGNDNDNVVEFLAIPFAKTKRFEYAELIDKYDELDCTKPGTSPMQKRAWPEYEHLEVLERKFYHREFREGIEFTYSEDVLNLNIYMSKEKGEHPVIVYFHGGGFDSGSIFESPFKGFELASRGSVVVFVSYRVGAFGYFTHEDIFKENNRDGNFGLDDMVKSLMWVKKNISIFGGDNNNITVMGQSAGAMSIQYLLCSKNVELFNKAIMMSGGGKFPNFSLPRLCEDTRGYWKEVMAIANCNTLEEFKKLPAKEVLDAVDKQKHIRKDNTYNTMPVVDHYLIEDKIEKLIKTPAKVPLIIGFTNNDMFTFLVAHIAKKYAKENDGYLYYFDVDAKGDNNQAFHSSELRYVFGTLSSSWRPYEESDYKVSKIMMDYITNFAKNGNPNGVDLPKWDIYHKEALHFTDDYVKMEKVKNWKLLKNTLKGDPQ